VGVPRELVGKAEPDWGQLDTFFSKNRAYPSVRKVREAKLKQIALVLGLNTELADVPASKWNPGGLREEIEALG